MNSPSGGLLLFVAVATFSIVKSEQKLRTALYMGITLIATVLIFFLLSLIYPAYGAAALGTLAAMDVAINCSLVGLWHSRKSRKQKEIPVPEARNERAPTPEMPRPEFHFTPKATGSEKTEALRQNLLRKVMWDEAVMERLIEFERAKLPNAPLHTLFESAIELWERDNR